jgi:signal transduction histidine kinase
VSGGTQTPGRQARRRGRWTWIGEGMVAAAHGLVLFGLALAGVGLLAVIVLVGRALAESRSRAPGGLSGPWWVLVALMLIPASLLGVRWLAGQTRRLAGTWCGVPIAVPYRPVPRGGGSGSWRRLRDWAGWLLADAATWRDLLWVAVSGCVGWLLALAPAGLVVYGLIWVVLPSLGTTFHQPAPGPTPYLGILPVWLAVPVGIAIAAAGLRAGPRLLAAYGTFARSMLGPTGQAELTMRVRHLAQTRADTIDSGAAEMRRIERDLHDGAQARLVAMGMTLDAADQLLDTSPAAARALLAEARESSAKALAELRDLVRGIHPPVLADRGLAEAVHALALDMPQRVHFASELPGRPPPPVESAAYFAASELLANVSKHAHAAQVWIDLRHHGGVLRIGVTDDGDGGADPARGTGLRGIERRIAAFDGVLAVSSPPGGPTVMNMEIPCALS